MCFNLSPALHSILYYTKPTDLEKWEPDNPKAIVTLPPGTQELNLLLVIHVCNCLLMCDLSFKLGWPQNGEIEFCNYSMRYREGLGRTVAMQSHEA